LILLAAFAVTGLGWFTLRASIESRLELAATRDLRAIVDLVATTVGARPEAQRGLKGDALAEALAGPRSDFAQSLERIMDEHSRRIYFFDARGSVVVPESGADAHRAALVSATPDIVRRALENRRIAEPAATGTIADPYADTNNSLVIGTWRWLPAVEIGIVAERPYAAIAYPLRWIDGLFAALLAALVVGALFTGMPPLAELTAEFRRPASRRCGPYQLERLLGEGAMADVYLARHLHLGRTVALKILKGGRQTDELAARFDREARLGSRVSHPNIVTIFEHGRAPEGGFYYTMEYIHGLTLPQWIRQHGPLVVPRAVRVLRQICAAVGAMHGAGLLHRDIKPDNVMVYAANGDYDLVKLIDFGLVKNLQGERTRDLTRHLRVLGTPAYMAPERLENPSSIDPRTDLYGIGAIGFFLLTGRRPFEADQDSDLAQQILHVEPPPVSRVSPFPIPDSLDALIRSLLAKDMAKRPPSAEALAAALAEIARKVPWQRELAGRWWRSVFPGVPDDSAAPGSAVGGVTATGRQTDPGPAPPRRAP
jgi:tRNA A-37 threonylcarbamoyl transferase component Bud32